MTAAKVYVTATIEVALYEEDDPLTEAEIDDLVSNGPSSWADWNVLNVGLKRDTPRSRLDGSIL